MLKPHPLFIKAGSLTLGDVSMSAEKQHLIHRRRIEAGIGSFEEELFQCVDAYFPVFIHGTDSAGEDVRRKRLSAVGSEVVIIQGSAFIVPDIVELEGKIVIVAIAWDGGILAWITLLIHLECTCKVLSSTNHGDRYVADENGPDDRVLFPESKFFQHGADAVRNAPDIFDYLYFIAVGFGNGRCVSVHFSLG